MRIRVHESTMDEENYMDDPYYKILMDPDSTAVQKYKAAAIYHAPKLLKKVPAYISYVENMRLTNRDADELRLDEWKFAENTANAFLTEHAGDYPTFGEYVKYVIRHIRKAYESMVSKLGMPSNPIDFDNLKMVYHGDNDSLSVNADGRTLEINSYRLTASDEHAEFRVYMTGFGYLAGYPAYFRIELSPQIYHTQFAVNTKNPELSAYLGNEDIFGGISVSVICPHFGTLGDTPDICKSPIKYNPKLLREFRVMTTPEKQKTYDVYVYRSYDSSNHICAIYDCFFYVRNVNDWESADKKMLAFVNAGEFPGKFNRDVPIKLKNCDKIKRYGIYHGMAILGDRVITEPYTENQVMFTGDVFVLKDYDNPDLSGVIDYCKDNKTFDNVGGKFYNQADVKKATARARLDITIKKAYTTAMSDGLFKIDGTGYDGLNNEAKFDYLYDPKKATLTWNGNSPLRFGYTVTPGQKEALEGVILQLIGDGKIELVDDSVYK